MMKDRSFRVEVHSQTTRSSDVNLLTLTSREGVHDEYSRSLGAPIGSVEKKPAHYSQLDRPQVFGRCFLLPQVLGRLEDDRSESVDHGAEILDGHRCSRVGFVLRSRGEAGRRVLSEERYWLDLGRGGHPLRRRVLTPDGQVVAEQRDISLARFEPSPGQPFWLPVSLTSEHFTRIQDEKSRTRVVSSSPISRETTRVVVGTTRFNTRPTSGTFRIDPRHGAIINDRIKNLCYEAGQDISPPPMSRAEARLEAELARADAQRDELRAMSWERSGPGWATRLPWAVAGTSVVILIAVLCRRNAR